MYLVHLYETGNYKHALDYYERHFRGCLSRHNYMSLTVLFACCLQSGVGPHSAAAVRRLRDIMYGGDAAEKANFRADAISCYILAKNGDVEEAEDILGRSMKDPGAYRSHAMVNVAVSV